MPSRQGPEPPMLKLDAARDPAGMMLLVPRSSPRTQGCVSKAFGGQWQ